MKETCENCADFADCIGICEKLKQQLEELPERSPEIPESQFIQKQSDVEKASGDTLGIDRFRKINPGRIYEDAVDTEIDWEETPPQPEAAELEKPGRKSLTDAITIATRREDMKLKRRFKSFLMCEKIVSIAARSGTTKQNIQKQFQLTVDKAYREILKRKSVAKASITPLKFKKKITKQPLLILFLPIFFNVNYNGSFRI